MRGIVKVSAVVLLSLVLGLHWAALQSVAWVSMFVERVQTQSIGSAFETTFDGQHPCRLCLVVRESRAENTESQAPAPQTVKLEAWARLEAVPLVSESKPAAPVYPVAGIGVARREPPVLPPPRFA